MARRRSGGLGLIGILVIAAVLYFSGAGGWLWQRMERFAGGDCYALANSSQVPSASTLCDGTSKIIAWLGQLPEQYHLGMDSLKQRLGFSGSLPEFSGWKNNISQQLASLGSGTASLKQRLQEGPQQLWQGDASSQLRPAIDHYTIGINLLSRGSANDGISWLRSGANAQGGYGLMSQLQLGSIYSHGASGIAPDAVQAHYYYEQAKASLQELQASNAPQAKQLLQSLPISPEELKAKLQ